jgi:FtsP/CotA-like multicopper oxidase with cupredoxin domain
MLRHQRELREWLDLRRQLSESRLSRREVKKLGLLLSGGVLLGSGVRAPRAAAQAAKGDPVSPPTTPWVERMPIPTVAAPVAPYAPRGPHQFYARFPAQKFYRMELLERQHSFHRDLPPSTIWGYGGTFPGPTVKARYGEPICIRFVNSLPSLATHRGFGIPQEITHLHNFHTAPESDGGPWDWIDPGQYRDHHYTMARAGFTLPTGNGPGQIPARWRDPDGGDLRESLSTLFFHHHRPEFTAANVYKGLVGFFLIHDQQDTGNETTGWRLPSGPHDVPLLLTDKQFDPDTGELIFDPFDNDGFLGDKLTVNGKIQPYFEVKRRKYRLRVLNGGPARFYTLVLRHDGSNQPFTQITESGNFLERPRRNLTRIEVQVAERSDLIVDFSRFPAGAKVYLANIMEMKDGRRPERGRFLNPDDPANQLVEFRVRGGTVTDPSRIPGFFRPYPPINLDEVVRRRVWKFERGNGAWQVNGQLFDPDIDHSAAFLADPPHQVRRNTAEIWVLQNNSGGWEHPVHNHFEESQVLSINGNPLPPGRRARLDVHRLGRNTTIEVFQRFRDFPDPDYPGSSRGAVGRYVMHCHNMSHEDDAMMVTWNVVP